MKPYKKTKFVVIFLFLGLILLGFEVNSSIAQEIKNIYTPNDSTVSYSNYHEIKEKLIEATNKATIISEFESDKWKRYIKFPDKNINYITELRISRNKYEIVTIIEGASIILSDKFSDLIIPKLYKDEEELYGFGIKNLWFYWSKDFKSAKQFADAIYALKHKKYIRINYTEELTKFEEIAKKYRDSDPKPEISEDVRKLYVQATTFSKDKKYQEAIGLYEKLFELDETFPDAHFNVALLLGQVEDYESAILEMKKYLMLIPDASDARAAQDKIYEWEAKIDK